MNGTYRITNNATGSYQPCMARNKNLNFANLAYQVKMTILSGTGGGGLIFRSDTAVTTFYRYSLDNKGAYQLIVCQRCTNTNNGGGKRLLQANLASGMGHAYTLTVIANGRAFYLYVNGIYVNQVRDATASAGRIGLYCLSSSQVAFSNLKVWAL